MFIVASLHYRSSRIFRFGWTMTCKWGRPVDTLPSDEGDYTSLSGRLPGHTQEQLGATLALGIAGALGYYARSTPMDMTTCKSIEKAIAQVLKAAGYATGWPRGQIYHAGTEGGIETHEHAYGIAAAALCDQ
eukprot:6204530-Pleurochrysis_carterae.AAC.1